MFTCSEVLAQQSIHLLCSLSIVPYYIFETHLRIQHTFMEKQDRYCFSGRAKASNLECTPTITIKSDRQKHIVADKIQFELCSCLTKL